jgi:hypothetical protein
VVPGCTELQKELLARENEEIHNIVFQSFNPM